MALLADDERSSRIKAYLSPQMPDRYADLAGRMSARNIGTIVVSNPLDIQELTGLGLLNFAEGAVALFDGEHVDLLSNSPIELPGAALVSQGASFTRSLARHTAGQPLAVDDTLPLSLARAMSEEPAQLPPAQALLRRWKEDRVLEDLPAYIVAGRVTSDSQEAAFAYAEDCRSVGKAFSPRDLYRRALQFRDGYAKENLARLGLRLLPYFVNLHSAHHSIYPSVPRSAPVDPRCNCIRFDTGVLLLDYRGLLRACSDVGRSLVQPGLGRDLYAFLGETIVGEVIPSLTPGRKINHIHTQLVAGVGSKEAWIKECGLMDPGDRLTEKYRRDVGHLLGKQEVTSLHFVPEEDSALEEGLVGDIEMPWLYADMALGYEDMFLVANDGGINISAK